jgi:hypothetical protein
MNLSLISHCSVKYDVYPRFAEVTCPVTSGNAMQTKFQDGELNAKGSKQMFQLSGHVVSVQLGSIAVIAMAGLLFYTRGCG